MPPIHEALGTSLCHVNALDEHDRDIRIDFIITSAVADLASKHVTYGLKPVAVLESGMLWVDQA